MIPRRPADYLGYGLGWPISQARFKIVILNGKMTLNGKVLASLPLRPGPRNSFPQVDGTVVCQWSIGNLACLLLASRPDSEMAILKDRWYCGMLKWIVENPYCTYNTLLWHLKA